MLPVLKLQAIKSEYLDAGAPPDPGKSCKAGMIESVSKFLLNETISNGA